MRIQNDWLLVAGALALGISYGALQNLALLIAFAHVPAPGIPTASAVWNIGFDAGTAAGAVMVRRDRSRDVVRGAAFMVVLLLLLAGPWPSRRGRPLIAWCPE